MRRLAEASTARSTDGAGSNARARHLALSILGAVCALCLVLGAPSALAATPELKIDPTFTPGYTTVEFSGEVDPKGDEIEWSDQISRDSGATWEFGDVLGFVEKGTPEANTPQLITNAIHAGLAPGTTYQIRITAFDYTTQELVASPEPSPEFTTKSLPAPTVTIEPVSAGTASTAHFSGMITPNSPAGDPSAADVTWHFVCEPGCPADEGEQTVSASAGETEVELEAGELQPSTAYEVRLVGKNAGDPVTAGPVTFQTEALAAPTVTLDPITTFAGTTATFVGHIDPDKPATGEAAASDVNWSFQCHPECPGLSVGTVLGTATGPERDVEVHATSLEPNTGYTVTLTGSNRGGPVDTVPQAFSTIEVPVAVGVGPGAAFGVGGYKLEGTVNPHNSVISECFFEWGPDTSYGHSAPCEPTPTVANKVEFVTASLSGLSVGAEYHFRLVARNGTGSVHTSDDVFVAHPPCPNEAIREGQNSTYLPECRAYELVSPAFKEGFSPIPTGFTDDGRLSYLSNGNYADNGNGGSAITGGNQYLAVRSAGGWSTTALAPSGPAYAVVDPAGTTAIAKGLSSDLRSSLWLMRRGDQPDTVSDLYVRGPDEVFTRIGSAGDPVAPPLVTGLGATTFNASDDLSHVVFSVGGDGSNGADGRDGTYEYDATGGEQPRLVSVDNAGRRIASGCGTQVGSQQSYYHAISADGRVIFWTTRECGASPVYARVAEAVTIDASESQCARAPSDPGGACNAESDAVFQGANADGTRVFFTTEQQLVDTDTDSTTDLYECAIPAAGPAPVGPVNPCPDLHQVSGAASGADVQGVTRISDDGNRAYFVATGVLASNPGADEATAVAGDDNLYVWDREAADPAGETKFIGKLDPRDSAALWGGDYAGRFAQTTDDGRYLVFAPYAALIDRGPQADTDTARDIYRYDAETGALMRVSVDSGGEGGNESGDDAQLTPIRYDPLVPSMRVPRSAMSEDGRSVVFNTADALSPADTNGTVDSYLWRDGRVSLISSGKPSVDDLLVPYQPLAEGAGIKALVTPSGRDIYFTTTAELTADDVDTTADIYDARIDGGFDLGARPDCASSAQGCQPPPGAPSGSPLAASTGSAGSGNLARARPVVKVRAIRSTSVSLRVTVPGAGAIKTAGDGTRPTSRRVKGAGTYEVRVKLSKEASARLRRSHRLKTRLRVTFTPTGGVPKSVTVPLRFRQGKGGGK